MRGILYKLDFSSGKSYVGITTGKFQIRLKNHYRAAINGNPSVVYAAWRKHGEPVAKVLAVIDPSLLLETEVAAIRSFNTLVPNGYNMTAGGEESPTKRPEIAARVSASLKGRIRSESHKENIRIAVQGKVLSEEHKRKISNSLLGNTRASALKGRKRPPRSAEWSANISKSIREKNRC